MRIYCLIRNTLICTLFVFSIRFDNFYNFREHTTKDRTKTQEKKTNLHYTENKKKENVVTIINFQKIQYSYKISNNTLH